MVVRICIRSYPAKGLYETARRETRMMAQSDGAGNRFEPLPPRSRNSSIHYVSLPLPEGDTAEPCNPFLQEPTR
jgi:hypothetical protein